MRTEWIKTTDKDPENLQNILVTDGTHIYAGGFYLGPDKFCLSSGVRFEDGGLYCDLENFTHWCPIELPIGR